MDDNQNGNNNLVEQINEIKKLILDQIQEREKDKKYLMSLKFIMDEVKDQNEELLDKIFNLEKQYKNLISNVKDIRRQMEHNIADDHSSHHSEEESKHSPLLARLARIERGEKGSSTEDKPSRLLSVVYFKNSD
jgi:uncharacterized protein YjcR